MTAGVDQFLALPAWAGGLVMVAAIALAAAFGCRVVALQVLQHRVPVWMVHVAGLIACGWIALSMLAGAEPHALDVAVLCMAGGHIWSTYHTWRGGNVPEHALREQPADLDWPALSMAQRDEDRS